MKTVALRTNQIVLQKMIASRTNRIVTHRHVLVVSMRRCVKYIAVWTNHIVLQKADSQLDKSYRNAQTRVTCFTAQPFHTSLSG